MTILSPNSTPRFTNLSNGIRIATIPVISDLTTVGVWVKSGSIYENRANNGVAHFLEHIIYRGNAKYPQSKLEKLADQKGINLKAATSRTTTSFFGMAEKNHVKDAIDMLAQLVYNPNINDDVVNSEKETILQEEFEVSHDFNEMLWDKLHEVSFGGCAVGMPILGTSKTIKEMTAKMLQEHYDKFFTPENSYFVCASKLEHERIVEMIQNATDFIKPNKNRVNRAELINRTLKLQFEPKIQLFSSNSLDRSWCSLGITGPGLSSELYYAAQLALSIIGNLSQSQLQIPPLLNSPSISRLNSHYVPYGQIGFLAFLGDCKFGKEQEWMTTVSNAIVNATVNVSEENLKMGKTQAMLRLLKNLDSTTSVADDLAINLLLNKTWKSPTEWKEILDKTKKEDLVNFAMTSLHQQQFSSALFMPNPKQTQSKK